MNTTTNITNKIIRGYILKLIYDNMYPKPMGSDVIGPLLLRLGMATSEHTLAIHLEYLRDRGYVELKEVALMDSFHPVVLVALTSEGVDLLEGTKADPGVTVQ
jgi:hypothetical protein